MKDMKTNKAGFTIIELLIVIFIILVIAAIVMVALSQSREHSRNTARATQVREYQKAINMHYSAHGYYPRINATNQTGNACLGDYSPLGVVSGSCWQGAQERAWFVNAITPQYMARIPEGESLTFGNGHTGMLYEYGNFGKTYSIRYFMKGAGQNCIVDHAVASTAGGDTLCTLTVQP